MRYSVGPEAPEREAVRPSHTSLHGRYTSLVPLRPEHAEGIFKHIGGEDNADLWVYMLTAGFTDLEECKSVVAEWSSHKQRLYYAVLSGPATDPDTEAAGLVTYTGIESTHHRIEIAGIIFGRQIQRSRQATEAMYLLASNVFDNLGYLRLEWRANSLNKASLTAATRLGFTHEGVFRQVSCRKHYI